MPWGRRISQAVPIAGENKITSFADLGTSGPLVDLVHRREKGPQALVLAPDRLVGKLRLRNLDAVAMHGKKSRRRAGRRSAVAVAAVRGTSIEPSPTTDRATAHGA